MIYEKSESQEKAENKKPVEIPGLVSYIQDKFQSSANDRKLVEERWLTSYRNYRGVYGPNITFSDPEQSRVFVKITKTKVIAAFGQLLEVLFGGDKFPIGIDPSPKPLGIAEYAHADLAQQQQQQPSPDPYGYEGDGRSLPPGATQATIIGGLVEKYEGAEFKEGPALNKQQQIQIEPALKTAKNAEKVIHDQLEEAGAVSALKYATFETVLLGTGCLKGPFSIEKTYHRWKQADDKSERIYDPIIKLVPDIKAVSVWDLYPDSTARSSSDVKWIIQRHRFSSSDLRKLLHQPLFNRKAIKQAILDGPNYIKQSYEDQIRPLDIAEQAGNKYEVLEYWGPADAFMLKEIGVDISSADPLDEININVWICGTNILRLVVNPFTPVRLPYLICPYEIDPYSVWGVGLAENMEDTQQIMNGHVRMAIDNLRFSGHVVFDIDEQLLVAGQDTKIYPGKIFRRQSGAPGQSVYGLKFPNTTQENLSMFDKARQLADEETGMPSYSHGTTGVTGTTRTAAGMSMLMGAAGLNIKTVVKNIDDFLLMPLGHAMYQWNMQFNEEDKDIVGDLAIKARGTSSLMQKEVRSQRLMMLINVGSNPQIAPFIKWHTVIETLAESLDIDPEKLIASPEDAALYANIIGMQNAARENAGAGASQQSPGMGNLPSMGGGTSPQDITGAGGATIGTGGVPQPGEAGFSANTGGSEAAMVS